MTAEPLTTARPSGLSTSTGTSPVGPGTGVRDLLAARRPGHALPGPMYGGQQTYAADLEHIWQREWVFAGHESELANVGDFITLRIGAFPVVVVRGVDGRIRALHNVCRHRGAILCDAAAGSTRRKLVCPYHQWAYELDGRLYKARTWADIEPEGLGLKAAGCEVVAGLVFVCVADEPPPFEPLRALVEPYFAPFDLAGAKIAAESVIDEAGNWKLVMENNRECYHCAGSHPELGRTFPLAPLHSGGGTEEENRATLELIEACERAGLVSSYQADPGHQFRVMRMALDSGARSMTMDGEPAVNARFSGLPDEVPNVGDILFFHYPSTWMHFMGDHVITFRMLPTGPRTTQLRTTWLVPGSAVEGVDYDVDKLTEVWIATNAQDSALVGRTQPGVDSPAFVPGPYSPVEEEGVDQFITWYTTTLTDRIDSAATSPAGQG